MRFLKAVEAVEADAEAPIEATPQATGNPIVDEMRDAVAELSPETVREFDKVWRVILECRAIYRETEARKRDLAAALTTLHRANVARQPVHAQVVNTLQRFELLLKNLDRDCQNSIDAKLAAANTSWGRVATWITEGAR